MRKTIDPKRIALLDRQEKLRAQFEKDYSRMKRALTRMEKCRRALARLARQMQKMEANHAP